MKRTIINDVSKIHLSKDKIVACIGFFDGLHKGHQVLIEKTKERAKVLGVPSALITFDPDPWSVLNRKSGVRHITPLKRKMELLEKFGMDEVIVLNFNSNVASLSPDDFVNHVLLGLGVCELVAGSDFRFGKRAQGNTDFLIENYAPVITTHVMGIKTLSEHKIGSTKVIQTILQGRLEETTALLGRYYSVGGFVIDGAKQGRKIGFPTANLDIVDEYVIPKTGVYMGYTKVNDTIYKSIINIGYNPTFNTREKIVIETHLLDFNEMIYGEHLHQYFVKRIRDEMKFDSIEALIEKMKQDEQEARDFLVDVDDLL
jgi:riboflavin kinase / FMN adenylyltransferase